MDSDISSSSLDSGMGFSPEYVFFGSPSPPLVEKFQI
jgi:hypothetical protein